MTMDAKPWRCKGGHTLGLAARNGSGIRQLWLYREAKRDFTAENAEKDFTAENAESAEKRFIGKEKRFTAESAESAENLTSQGEGEIDVIAVVEGYAADVRCSICGRVRTWVPGEEALLRLMREARRLGIG